MMYYIPTLVACTLTYVAVSQVASLGKIAGAMTRAIPGAANMILLVVLVMSCFATLGAELFGECPPPAAPANKKGTAPPPAECVGAQYFGSYGDAMFTLFTMLTPGTDWAGDVARPLMAELGKSVAWYFVAYVLVVTFVMTNVLRAVILEKMR